LEPKFDLKRVGILQSEKSSIKTVQPERHFGLLKMFLVKMTLLNVTVCIQGGEVLFVKKMMFLVKWIIPNP
jgi:hypothetical protein